MEIMKLGDTLLNMTSNEIWLVLEVSSRHRSERFRTDKCVELILMIVSGLCAPYIAGTGT